MEIYEIELLDYRKYIVIDDNPSGAYKRLRAFLDKEDLGFYDGRKLRSIKVIADNYVPRCNDANIYNLRNYK